MSKSDTITNWYTKIPKSFQKSDVDKTYQKHLIKNNSMILSVGATGVGKTNGSVIEFLHRTNGKWFEIIIFTGSNKKEPLYQYLQEQIHGIKLIDNPIELPKIEEFKESDLFDFPKLIVFDDSIYEDKKNLKHIEKWFMCARKANFTCIFLSQSYHATPIFIRRNAMYLQLFKVTDLRDMKTILSKYCMDIDLTTLKNMLNFCTKDKGNFMTIEINAPLESRYKKNFTQILDPKDYK